MSLTSRLSTVFFCLFIAVLYALPNLYPDRPALILESGNHKQDMIVEVLHKAELPHEQLEGQLLFQTVDDQMHARDLIQTHFGHDVSLSLNLVSQCPSWLQSIGANAMKLGLDLQGGIHFLLEVDTDQLEKTHDQGMLSQISNLLKTNRIRYTDIQLNSAGLNVACLNEQHAQDTAALLSKHYPHFSTSLSTDIVHLQTTGLNNETVKYAVDQTVNALEKRINELGISEATITKQGDRHISIDLPGIQDIVHAKKIIGKTATLKFHLVDSERNPGSKQLMSEDGSELPLSAQTVLSGDSIAFAHARLSDGLPVVEIRLDGNAHSFYKATADHVGERLAVVYSETKPGLSQPIERIISAPTIRQPLGDNFVISGVGQYEEAQDLALLLRSGALAAPVQFIEETTIGPSLGGDNIMKGLLSLVVGSSVVFVFMLYYYRALGMIANFALIINVVSIVALLSILGATLTLPGIAGIVLSVGMAVDSNVLINERIREEMHSGASISQAVHAGYDKALSAIIDANVTTLLVTFILFGLGSGAVKGFAVTTCMGIIASIFTSVYLTRALTELSITKGWIKQINMSADWFSHIPTINFMKLSQKAFKFSIMLLALCVMILPMKGLQLGLDFTGGQQITLETTGQTSSEEIREILARDGIEQSQVTTYGSSQTFQIKIGHTEHSANDITNLLVSKVEGGKILQAEYIGPQVGSNMLTSSLMAVGCALLMTMIYVALRFEYRFAVSAIVSLIHDPILILGIFSLCQIEFNLVALAAMLTILGYSINDTIVVYDRVRECFQSDSISPPEELMNHAINQTLSRTILTSCLTLSVVMALYCFGGDYLTGFSISLAIGIIIGTYSSIYVAGSLAVRLGLTRNDLVKSKNVGELI